MYLLHFLLLMITTDSLKSCGYSALKASKSPLFHVQSYSAMFCWVDMRGALLARRKARNLPDWDTVENTWEEEQELWSDLVYKHKVLVTPGM
jgi:hypothetical protein